MAACRTFHFSRVEVCKYTIEFHLPTMALLTVAQYLGLPLESLPTVYLSLYIGINGRLMSLAEVSIVMIEKVPRQRDRCQQKHIWPL